MNRLELLPDGLINYYDHLLDPESPKKRLFYRARMGLRQLAARLHGLRYEFLPEGHITQYERGTYSRTWTENRTGMVSVSGTLEVLPPRDPKAEGAVSGGGEVLLILDQELGQLVDEALESRMRERLSAEVQSSGFRSILYKCHPRGRNRHGWFCNRLGRDIEDLSGPLLAEELVELRGATSIVGFYSTPLILSAAQVNTRVAILPAPGQSGVRRPRRLTEIRSALERTGVRIIPP